MLRKACLLRKTRPTGTAQNSAVMMVLLIFLFSFFFFLFSFFNEYSKIEKALVNIHFEDNIDGVD